MAPVIAAVTRCIQTRGRATRSQYLGRFSAARRAGPGRAKLSCANYAHAFAGQAPADKLRAGDLLHLNPKAQSGGPLARLVDGNVVLPDASMLFT